MSSSRITLLAAALTFTITATASAALQIYEPFLSGSTDAAGQYDPGTVLNGQSPTVSNFSGTWSGGDGDASSATTIATGLTYSTPFISSLGTGGSVGQAGFDFNDMETRSTTLTNNITTNNQTRWFMGLFEADSDNGNTDYMNVELDMDTADDAGTTPFEFGIRDLSFYANGASLTGTDYTAGTTALIIGRVTVGDPSASSGGPAGIETIDFWFNPQNTSTLADLNATAQATATSSHNVAFGGEWGGLEVTIDYNTSSGQGRQLDELAVGDELSDLNTIIQPIPEPTSAALLTLAGLALIRRRRRA